MELILYAAILSVFFYRSKNRLLLVSYFVVLLLYAGYRDIFVGTDTLNYLRHFDLVSSGVLFLFFYSKEVEISVKEILSYKKTDFDPILNVLRQIRNK